MYHASLARPAMLRGKVVARASRMPTPLPPPTGGGFSFYCPITGGNAALTPGCVLDALSGLRRAEGQRDGRDKETKGTKGRALWDFMRPRSQEIRVAPKVAFGENTASVKCGNVKMLPVPILPIPIASAAQPPFFLINWGEAYHASMGVWGRCEPPQRWWRGEKKLWIFLC